MYHNYFGFGSVIRRIQVQVIAGIYFPFHVLHFSLDHYIDSFSLVRSLSLPLLDSVTWRYQTQTDRIFTYISSVIKPILYGGDSFA